MVDASNSNLPLMTPDQAQQIGEKSLPPSPKLSSRHSKSSRSSSPKERPRNPPTAKELMRILAAEQDTTWSLQQELSLLTSQLSLEQDRADVAESKTKEAVLRFKEANDARLTAQAEVVRLREELRLFKTALSDAQKEILKAQNILKEVEDRKREAEEEVTQLRRKLRKLNEEKMIEVAREEGRKLGLQEGLEMGKDIGYLRGRNSGYVNGRQTIDRMMERYFSPPSESEARRSRGEPDLPLESDPPYTATTTRFPPSAGFTPSSSSSSSSERESRHPRPRTGAPRMSPARTTMYSPSQPIIEIPLDGFIPEVDGSNIIRLPPPHELIRPPPTPITNSPKRNSPSPRLLPVPVPGDVPVLMVPEPRSPADPLSELIDERQHRKVRRRSSGESVGSSTRTSELDLLHAPDAPRSSGLSAIPEVTSLQEAGVGSLMVRSLLRHVYQAGFVHVSMPAPMTPGEMARLKTPRSSSRLSVDQRGHSRPVSTSSFGTVNITIQPPSRPASNNSSATGSGTRSHLLSPADADRPVPLPSPSSQPTPMMDAKDDSIVMDLPNGGLPPGFVPMGPPTPHGGETSHTGVGVPLPPSTVGTYHRRLPSQGYGSVNGDMETPVVIPSPSGRYAPGESDESSSDTDTLTTPPRRYQVPSSAGYSAAGVPLPASGYTAAGISLPATSVAGTPYSYARSPGSDMKYVNAGVTPAALGRAKSFSTDRGSVRG